METIDHILILSVVFIMTAYTITKILTIDSFYRMTSGWKFGRNSYVSLMTIGELFYLFGVIILLKYELTNYGVCLLVLQGILYAEMGIKGRYSKTFYMASSLLSLFFLMSFLITGGGM